jgi:CHAD domain-containing protein
MATVGTDELDRPVGETARRLALAWLAEADDALDRLHDPVDVDALHDFRVALRRFRSTLRAYRPYLKGSGPKKASRRIRDLASATNPGRDAEVAIVWLEKQADAMSQDERPGYDWLLRRLEAEKVRCYDEARKRIARDYRDTRRRIARRLSDFEASCEDAVGPDQRSFALATGELILDHADDLKALLATIRSPAHESEAHDSRIAAKRLRYLIEPLRRSVDGVKPLVIQLKSLQDVLGELHDTHVLAAEIADSMPAVAAERAGRRHVPATDPVGSTTAEGVVDGAVGLLALAQRLQQRQRALHEDFTSNWLAEESVSFFRGLTTLERRLRQRGEYDPARTIR